jgi:type IV secretion system protein VirB9
MRSVQRFSAVIAALTLLLSNAALAEVQPRRGTHDARVRLATFQDGQVYQIRTSLTHVTSIEFGPGETIRSIIAGDTEGFLLDGVPGGQAFAIKPVVAGAHTNITVYTNRRSYYFNVTEASSPTFYVIRFHYPEAARDEPRAIARQPDNHAYGVSTRSEITPMEIWDDGTFTYFRFESGAPVPAIFRWSAGRERSVNAIAQDDGVIRVSGVNARWVLRLGDAEVCIQDMREEGSDD